MLETAAPNLLPSPVLAAVLAVLGLAAGPALSLFAARRTVVQPVAMALKEEGQLITGVLANVARLPFVSTVSGSDFAAADLGRIWAALLECAPECSGLPDDVSDEDCESLGSALAGRSEAYLQDVADRLAQGPAPVGDVARFRELLVAAADPGLGAPAEGDRSSRRSRKATPATEEELRAAAVARVDELVLDSAAAVLFAGGDRNRLRGAGLILPTSTPDSVDPENPPLQRVYVAPSKTRQVISALLTGLTAAFTPAYVQAAGLDGSAAVIGAASVLVLITMSLVISLVDLDTFYIDLRVFIITGTVSWLLAIASSGAAGDWTRWWHGAGIVLAIAVLFEVANRVHKLVRKEDGQGFGDTLIVLATAGVPPALAADWTLGYYSMMAGMVAGVLGWVVGAARGRMTRRTPFAFGPYLAAGWVIAWTLLVASM